MGNLGAAARGEGKTKWLFWLWGLSRRMSRSVFGARGGRTPNTQRCRWEKGGMRMRRVRPPAWLAWPCQQLAKLRALSADLFPFANLPLVQRQAFSSPARRGGESGTGGIGGEQADGCRPSAASANGARDG